MVVYYNGGNNYDNPLSQLIRLQNKAVRVMNDGPLRVYITPYYIYLGLFNFRDIVKMYTCLLLYDHLCDNKPCNFSISLVSKQHNQKYPTTLLEKINRILHKALAECPYLNLGYYLMFLGKLPAQFTASKQDF